MTSNTTKPDSLQPAAQMAVDLFDNWFDPIETEVRARAREFVEELIRGELDAVLARPRYGRSQMAGNEGRAGVAGHRHGSRTRSLTGTFGLERRDAEFEQKMAEVLCVYREVQVLKKAAAKSKKPGKPVAIVSYDEKPGIQAIATTAPDLPLEPGVHASFARDYEYKRHGTLSLLAGIDLLTGKVHALVRDSHRSREFIEFLKLLDTAYPARTAIKLILDNHSAHISRETRTWLATRSVGRFEFTFTPKHGSWLNLIEGFFSKFARSVLRHIRVTSKQELKKRIMAGIADVNRYPVIHSWSYKLAEAA